MEPYANSRAREFHDFDESEIDDDYTRGRRRRLWPKIRAIYSKADEDFVRCLQAELGKMFYDVIHDAESYLSGQETVRDSRLVVIVLSEKFLGTEACMAEFMSVMNDSNWLCLFYELDDKEFRSQNSFAKWIEVWKSWQGRIEVCDEATWWSRLEGRALDCFEGNTIEVIKIVAKTISSRFIPLQVHWSKEASRIQGRTRLCSEVDKCLFEGPLCGEHVRMLGLHGMWSVGKTSLAKVLCEFYYTEFQGRVYHAELLDGSSHLQLMKDLLRNLVGVKRKFLEQHLADLAQAYAYFDHCIKQSSEKLFLVVDNIQDSWECLERARDMFLRRVTFPKGSMVVCLARSSHTLAQLFLPLNKLYRIEKMPLLDSREGYEIFLDTLFSDLSQTEAILWQKGDAALKFSSFLKIFVDREPHTVEDIHPLIFKSLGFFLREKGAKHWLLALEREPASTVLKDIEDLGKWKDENVLKTVFKALQKIYDLLDQQVQQVFINVALYVPKKDLSWMGRLHNDNDYVFSSVFECLQKLQAVTLLTLEERKIKMHSFSRKFAENMVRNSKALVYEVGKTVEKDDVDCRFNEKANVVERVCFKDCSFKTENSLGAFILDLSKCEHLQVLRLLNVKCQHMLQVFLGQSKLVTLEIFSVLTPVIVTGDFSSVRCFSCCVDTIVLLDVPVSGHPGSRNLEVLEMYTIDAADGSKRFCADINMDQRSGNVISGDLQSRVVRTGCSSSRRGQEVWNLQKIADSALKSEFLTRFNMLAGLQSTFEHESGQFGADINMEQSVRKVALEDFQGSCELEVLWLAGNVVDDPHGKLNLIFWPGLRQLTLFRASNLMRMVGLECLYNLSTLHVQSLDNVTSLHGIESLSRLQEVHIIDCRQLDDLWLPGGKCLTHCCIWFCDSLRRVDVSPHTFRLELLLPTSLEVQTGKDEDNIEEGVYFDNEVEMQRRVYPFSDQDNGKITCSDSPNCEEFIGFSSESKFSIVGCRNLGAVHDKAIEGTEVSKLLVVGAKSLDPDVLNLLEIQCFLPRLALPISTFVISSEILLPLRNFIWDDNEWKDRKLGRSARRKLVQIRGRVITLQETPLNLAALVKAGSGKQCREIDWKHRLGFPALHVPWPCPEIECQRWTRRRLYRQGIQEIVCEAISNFFTRFAALFKSGRDKRLREIGCKTMNKTDKEKKGRK